MIFNEDDTCVPGPYPGGVRGGRGVRTNPPAWLLRSTMKNIITLLFARNSACISISKLPPDATRCNLTEVEFNKFSSWGSIPPDPLGGPPHHKRTPPPQARSLGTGLYTHLHIAPLWDLVPILHSQDMLIYWGQ